MMLKYINDFLSYMELENMSQITIKNYKHDLMKFEKWLCECSLNLLDIALKDLRGYLATLNSLSTKTKARHISTLRSLYKWLHGENIITNNVAFNLRTPKQEKKEIDIMEDDDIYLLLRACEEDVLQGNKKAYRDYVILQLFLSMGLRREEVSNIKLSDVSLNDFRMLIHGKGNKQRYVYFNSKVQQYLSDYIVNVRPDFKYAENSEYLFVSQKTEKIAVNSINMLVNKYMEMTNCKKKGRSAHTLRKKYATVAYQNTGDIYAVSKSLGHESISTTQIYVKADEERKKNLAMAVQF